jgi:hypothetical protein
VAEDVVLLTVEVVTSVEVVAIVVGVETVVVPYEPGGSR